jgi:NAD(P)-dependent dehydrogenase (short-subunit alcohol dehydrogenase family)
LGAKFVQLDVTDDASVDAAVKAIKADGGLDVLVNNVEPRRPDGGFVEPAETTADAVRTVFETNVFGVVRVPQGFLPLLQRSANPVVVNVSSGLSSAAALADPAGSEHLYPDIAYPASKAAVNTLTVQDAKAFGTSESTPSTPASPPPISTTTLAPRPSNRTPGPSCAWPRISADGPTGTFQNAAGQLPW